MPASDVSTNILIPNSRILYVDPNDIYGHVNGVPITPDYSDLCIAFDLQCEIVARYKINDVFGESEDGQFNIGFTKKVGVKGHWASLLQGEAYKNKQFLTTYYTDINYDNFVKETVVEGLGVESVSIAFESYYTPNITIKFVDHRGSALFGREEAIHYQDKITIDNIFGAFFTIPYPKFRLQVKGFYGKAVTYQLSCTSFKGSLNSETGNFEAVATFIGYSYSLLTDIPFEYLIAAPYCEYVGRDYWDSKKGKEEWRMEWGVEGDEVPTFFELFQKIHACFTDDNLFSVTTQEEEKIIDTANNEIFCLDQINEYYTRFINSIDDIVQAPDSKVRNYEPGTPVKEAKILFMSNETNYGEWSMPKTWWENLKKSVELYNEGFGDRAITEDILPKEPVFDNIKFTPFFVKSPNGDIVFKNVKESSVERLAQTNINGNTMGVELAKTLIDFYNKAHSRANILPNVYLLDCGSLSYVLENRISELKTQVSEIQRKTERNYLHLAIENLGIVPYIGNIFKLIMCHIETFIEMMYQCYENIKVAELHGQRTAGYLGINNINSQYNGTDVKSAIENIPPWPSVNRKDTGDTEYAELERNNTLGWVGDFSDYFEEAKLVRALYLACKRTSADPAKVNPNKAVTFFYAPIIPNDLNDNLNPFDGGKETLSAMAGMIGIRIAQIFGVAERSVVDDEIAKTFGKVDALNYYRFLGGSKTRLQENILDQCKENLAGTIYDIMLCRQSADKYGVTEEGSEIVKHDFEFTTDLYKDIKRHPIFAEVSTTGGDVLNYTYMPSKSHYGIVPANTKEANYYTNNNYIKGTRETGHYFEYDYLKNTSFLHCCTGDQLFSDYVMPEQKTRYQNKEMYNIVVDAPTVNGIFKRYEEMKGGTITVAGETFKIDTSKILDRYWYLDTANRYVYYTKTWGFFTKTYKDAGIEEKMLLGDKFDSTTVVSDTYNKLIDNNLFATFTEKGLTLNNEVVQPETLIVPRIRCAVGGAWYSLFGIDFYYMQNQISDADVRNKVKALLFLHSLPYSKDYTLKWDVNKIGHATISRIPYGLAAFYGGLLWRHNQILKNHQDPIRYGGIYKPAYDSSGEYALFTTIKDKWTIQPERLNGRYSCRVFSDDKGGTSQFVFKRKPDYLVANELINIFNQFVNNQWKTISNLELLKKDGTPFSNGNDFNKMINSLYDITENAINKVNTNLEGLSEEDLADIDKDQLIRDIKSNVLSVFPNAFSNFKERYCFAYYYIANAKDKMILWLNADDQNMQEAIRTTYLGECIELKTMSSSMGLANKSQVGRYSDIYLSISNVKSYLSGFAEQLNGILNNTNNDFSPIGKDLEVVEDTPEFNRETALPIYLYLKMLWDKWLVSLNLRDHEFMVKNFDDNFIFIDSFYRNIEHRFMINCQILLDCYNDNTTSNLDISVFKFIGDITSKHHCLFVAVPDFITNWAHEDPTLAIESLKSIFTPIPYSQIPAPEEHNKFVTIYIPKLSESPSELNNFRDDGFNIWSYNDVNKNDQTVDTRMETLPDVLCSISNVSADIEGDITRYGYYVPSFGLAYGRQNNHIFKNMQLSMDAPIMSSAVINTLSHNSRKGANNAHKVAYIGQDIYPVFSNYSYICEFEMMGCAQIQPLMYFQLLNTPMWRGTYIILNVSHSMTPGNMVTKIKAMKLSNRAVPYSNAWFTKNPRFDPDEYRKKVCLDRFAEGGYNISVAGGNMAEPNNEGDGGTPINVNVAGNEQDPADVCKACYKTFIDAGATDAAAKGILVNIAHESGFKPYALGWDGNEKKQKFGMGGGLCGFYYHGAMKGLAKFCGWSTSKLDELNNRVASCGLPHPTKACNSENRKHIMKTVGNFPFTFKQQLAYLAQLSYFSTIKTYTDGKEASMYWEKNFEKPRTIKDRWTIHISEIEKYLKS